MFNCKRDNKKMKHSVTLLFLFCIVIGNISAQDAPRHSAEAEQLLQCLRSIEGKKTISGTMACVNWNLNEAKWVHQHTGKWPALNGFDYIHHHLSTEGGWIDYNDISEVIRWNNEGGLVTVMWHWNVPANRSGAYSFYWGTEPDKTTFDVRKIFEPESKEHKLMLKDIDQIASYLKLLKEQTYPCSGDRSTRQGACGSGGVATPRRATSSGARCTGASVRRVSTISFGCGHRLLHGGSLTVTATDGIPVTSMWTLSASMSITTTAQRTSTPPATNSFATVHPTNSRHLRSAAMCQTSASNGMPAASGSSSCHGMTTGVPTTPTAPNSTAPATAVATQHGGKRPSRTTSS